MHRRQLSWIIPIVLAILLGWKAHSPTGERDATQEIGFETLLLRAPRPAPLPTETLAAIRAGRECSLTFGKETKTFLFEPMPLLSEAFQIAVGPGTEDTLPPPEVFSGWALDPSRTAAPARATLCLVGDHALGTWMGAHGTTWQFRWKLGSTEVSLSEILPMLATGSIENDTHCRLTTIPGLPSPTGREIHGKISFPTATQGGLEPATGETSRYLNPILASDAYERSLKDLDVTLVFDQAATGPNETNSLTLVASQWLASAANVATIYENQLGIRLRLQEIILIPDDPSFTDIPSDNALTDFRSWIAHERPRATYQWQSAFKIGAGLRNQDLGLAFVGALGTSDSIGVIRPHSGWSTLAHELGHTIGATHTKGGLMNSAANDGGDRDFFTEAAQTLGRTAAWQIYEHSKDRLSGTHHLRHPEEIPFAKNDFRVIPPDQAFRFDPRQNDLRNLPFGTRNGALSLDSFGQVQPPNAGTLQHNGGTLTFEPSSGFRGPVWFSYTLRGSVGNEGKGWLHRGDVTFLVGTETPKATLVLAPGEGRTFSADNAFGTITQPRHAIVHRLIDDDRLIIRVNHDASGTDAFSVGSHAFEVTYTQAILETHPDRYWHHHEFAPLVMHPLVNDISSSTSGIKGDPANSVGPDPSVQRIAPFSHGLQLVSAENLSPDKGTLEVIEWPIVIAGEPALAPSGILRFTPQSSATGTATLRYTVEGPGGKTASESITIYLAKAGLTLVDRNALASYQIPRTAINASSWFNPAFNDNDWAIGSLPIGYEDRGEYQDVIQTDVGSAMVNVNSSLYARIPFEVSQVDQVSRLLLRMRMDDGFVAYLNGKEVVRDNTPDTIDWIAQSPLSREASTSVEFDLTEARHLLRPGRNLLAIHGMNARLDSSDFLLMPELIALTLPSIATITSPTSSSISVSLGNGVIFEQEGTPEDRVWLPVTEPVTTHWQILNAPPNSTIQAAPLDDGSVAIRFPEPGNYTIRLTARDAVGLETSEDRRVRVGFARPYDQVANAITTPPDQDIDTLTTELNASITTDAPWITPETRWAQIKGPAMAGMGSPTSLTTLATFPRPGRYHFRFSSSASGIHLFKDLHVDVSTIESILIGKGASSTYQHLPANHWTSPDFDDAPWLSGGQGLGYDITGDFEPYIDTDIQATMQFLHPGVYTRYPFHLENARSVHELSLQLRLDDGGVVYLNGHEVYRQQAPLYDLGPSSTALRSADESQIAIPTAIDLSEHYHILRQGRNVLAIHGLNLAASSSDFLIQPTLTAKLGQGNGAPSNDLLAYALGPNATPEVSLSDDILEIRYQERADLQKQGGLVAVEFSSDLQHWVAWKPLSHVAAPSEADNLKNVTLTGLPQPFIRLRVDF